ncbi:MULTISPECIES: ABC transporter ATP-binding protein [unclassified Leisingera]|uniref:ABC transporter ATP-binding protein n=1 Tax=unclassified Leisingera TaxID=2614906 RepID=UPI00030FAE22|nr:MULTISPECIES: ABC transporter ATP-binding protein [unclassified Leisingera]KIC22973.1 leucine/isoleucine/valine transporter ATP-binding subunit [Leisingera sp. ANG-S3]KIC52447.1 leucine/isoleucine/valine transporter ATP-binding subunit [Leisingera sp. ANG-S]KID07464.1 leucine/isoleucine/valine transporter ATP-binding subunit [Leisingera sp. ANG1]
MLEVKGVNAFYSDFHVLHDASLRVNKGELVAVVGANGHGKSTLLKTICGLVPAKSGQITFDGQDIAGRKAPHLVGRGLVYVAEDRRLFPDMSVLENLQLGAYLPEARRREKENLDRVFSLYPRLAERRSQLCRSLSGGEAQMVALGRGLMSNPSLLAIDEPSLGLAPNLTETMLRTVSQLNREGLTVLLVEQSLALLEGMIDRVYSIEEGVVTETNNRSLQEAL